MQKDDNTPENNKASLNDDVLNDSLEAYDAYAVTDGASEEIKDFSQPENTPTPTKKSAKPKKSSAPPKKVLIGFGIAAVVAFAIVVVLGGDGKNREVLTEMTEGSSDFLTTIDTREVSENPLTTPTQTDNIFSDVNDDIFAQDSEKVSNASVDSQTDLNSFEQEPSKPVNQDNLPSEKTPPQTTSSVQAMQPATEISADALDDVITKVTHAITQNQYANTTKHAEQDTILKTMADDIVIIKAMLTALTSKVAAQVETISDIGEVAQKAAAKPTPRPVAYIPPELVWMTFVEGRGVALVEGTTREIGLELGEQLKGRGTIKSISSQGCISFVEGTKDYAPLNGSCDRAGG